MDPSSRLCVGLTGGQIGMIIALVVLILFSAFFSATEMAFSTANKVRLRTLADDGNKQAERVIKMLGRYDRLLSTVLIGNNIVNITSSAIATLLFATLILNSSIVATVSTAVMTVLVLIFGEITPKTIAKQYSEWWCMKFWWLLSFFEIILFPIDLILTPWKLLINKIFKKKKDVITEDELITYVETAESEGGIEEHESQLIRSAIEFEDLDVNDIMVPRVNVVAIEKTEVADEIAKAFFENGFSRMPVYDKTIDTVVGVLHEKDFYHLYRDEKKKFDLKSIVQPTVCVSGSMKISTVLRMLQKAKLHMAIVVDEFGGTEGIVTLEDILEELVGEIWDEHDEIEVLSKKIDAETFSVSGTQNIWTMFEELELDVKEEFDATTVGGWVIEQLGKIPTAGESFMFENLAITVVKANAKRVLEIKVRVVATPDEKGKKAEKDADEQND